MSDIFKDNMAEKKPRKKKLDVSAEIKPMSREEADAVMSDFFAKLEEQYKDVPQTEIDRTTQKIKDFLEGKVSWAEIFNFTPQMLYQMAEFGYTQFKMGRYQDAERVFKMMTVLDWNNHYYHSMMGAILQRQKRYGEAMAEYAQAIELDPGDVVSHTNRGEVFMLHGLLTEAEADFKKAIALDAKGENKWANRARMLMTQLEKRRKKG